MDMDLTSRLAVIVYLSIGLILFGILQLVLLVVILLHCHDTEKQRTFASIGCLATTLLSMGILVLFAAQPQLLMEQTLPQNDVIYEPINRNYDVALEQFQRQTDEELVQSMRRLQSEEICCLHMRHAEDGDSCFITMGNGDVIKSSRNCVQFFYDFYLNWQESSEDIIQIMGIVFCAILGLTVLVNIYLLLSTKSASYTVQRREPGKYRANLSSFTYVPFESDVPVREGSIRQTPNKNIFWVNNSSSNAEEKLQSRTSELRLILDYQKQYKRDYSIKP